MNSKKTKIILFFIVCLIAAAAFQIQYYHDNKYIFGSIKLDSDQLMQGEPAYLTHGWELYPDVLLSPADLRTGQHTPVMTYIGQYLSLSSFHADLSPYGEATYRLLISYQGSPSIYNILLPEVYSSCIVYVNGMQITSSGRMNPYIPLIKDLVFPIYLDKETELVIQTSNYSHYYSGVTFPPILAKTETLHRMSSIRMIFYGFLCFTSIAIALFSSAVWFGTKKQRSDQLSLWFAGLSLSFAVRISYPFIRLIGVPLTRPLYALEDASSLFGIWCALQIICGLCSIAHKKWLGILLRLAFGMIVVSVIIPLFILPSFPAYTAIYGQLISWYKLIISLLLAILALLGRLKQGSLLATSGIAVYSIGLYITVTRINMFEPVYTGWPDEYGSYILVLCFAGIMVQRSHTMVHENIRLRQNLQSEVEHKTRQISELVDERQKLLSEFIHDLKSPVSALMTYTGLIRQNDILLDEVTKTQLKVIEEKSRDVSGQISYLQEFTLENPMIFHIEWIDLTTFLTEFHLLNQPDVEANGIDFELKLLSPTCLIQGDKNKLKRALQNLIFNSVSFTPENGCICLILEKSEQDAIITITDNGCGISPDALENNKLFHRSYTTRADLGGKGLGLYIVKSIISEHKGEIHVTSKLGKGSAFQIRLPL